MQESADLQSIVARARAHETEALDLLVDLYAARLHGFAYRMTGRVDDAEEIVQEVFVRLVRSIHAYKEDGRFEAWLFRIAANLVRDRARRNRRSPIVGHLEDGWSEQDDDAGQPRTPPVAQQAEPANELVVTEDVTRLQVALETLLVEEREVVMLRHYSDMTFAEIAQLMGTPLGTALARASRLGKTAEMHGDDNVKDERHHASEIESGERWLRDACKEPPPPDFDRIKLRVHVAAQEAWLASQLEDDTPGLLPDRVKAAVRCATDANRSARRPTAGRSLRPAVWWMTGISGAAAAVIFAIVGLQRNQTPEIGLDELYVSAFESAGRGEFDVAIDTLSAEIDEIEVAWSTSASATAEEWMYLNIDEGLDSLSTDPLPDNDLYSTESLDLFEG